MNAKYTSALRTVGLLTALVACGGAHEASPTTDPAATPPAPGDPSTSGSSGGADPQQPTPGAGTTTTADSLFFAVVGDTRPPSPNDIAGYPTPIITSIYADIAKRNPAFVIGTGDYQFSSTYGDMAGKQIDIYMGARAQYKGPFYPAMGNHECTGATASNCGAEGKDATTSNYTAFLTKMLGPIAKTEPYYAVHVNATDASWTAKFLILAPNAWSTAQGTWLDQAMSEATTYTFVVHHEPAYETQAPGVAPSQAIIAKHPYTLAICGHTHTYKTPYGSSKEVIVGNGGAPATGGVNYGYGLFQRRADGTIQADMIDYQTAQPTPSLTFAFKADGSATK